MRRYDPRPHDPGATVSVVITCYNYSHYLRAAVDSVLRQEDVHVDVIIVDDASQDDSLVVARQLASADSRVRVIANDVNQGAVATFNRGLVEATGEFLVRLDADDLLTPGSLRRAVAVMQRLPEVGLVYGHPIHFRGAALPLAREKVGSWIVWAGKEWLTNRSIDGTNTITSPEVVMRRSVVDVTGGQRPLTHAHDMEMWLRLSAYCDVAYVRGSDQAWHREHAGSLSTTAEKPIVILGEIREVFDTLFDDVGRIVQHGDRLRVAAHRAVAMEALDQVRRTLDRGRPDTDAALLLEFAAECSPAIRSSHEWKRTAKRIDAAHRPRFVVVAVGAIPRLRRRLRSRRRYARWTRTGEYERMRLTRGPIDDAIGPATVKNEVGEISTAAAERAQGTKRSAKWVP